MNKPFIILLASISSFLSCLEITSNNEEDKDLVKWELKDKVKQLEEKVYQFIYNVDLIDLDNPDFERDFILQNTEHVSFNENGMIKKHDSYRPTDLEYRTLQSFSDQGKVETGIIYNKEGLVDYFIEMSYDSNANLIKNVTFNYDRSAYLTKTISYNELQQKVEQVDYRYQIKMWTRIFQYDRKGRVEIETFESEQNPSRRVYAYNSNGKLSSIIYHEPDGAVIKEELYEYKKSNLTQKTTIDPIKKARTIIRYNAEGFISEDERWVMENGVESLKTMSVKYRYDAHDNWIRRDSYNEERLTQIHLRNIEYY